MKNEPQTCFLRLLFRADEPYSSASDAEMAGVLLFPKRKETTDM